MSELATQLPPGAAELLGLSSPGNPGSVALTGSTDLISQENAFRRAMADASNQNSGAEGANPIDHGQSLWPTALTLTAAQNPITGPQLHGQFGASENLPAFPAAGGDQWLVEALPSRPGAEGLLTPTAAALNGGLTTASPSAPPAGPVTTLPLLAQGVKQGLAAAQPGQLREAQTPTVARALTTAAESPLSALSPGSSVELAGRQLIQTAGQLALALSPGPDTAQASPAANPLAALAQQLTSSKDQKQPGGLSFASAGDTAKLSDQHSLLPLAPASGAAVGGLFDPLAGPPINQGLTGSIHSGSAGAELALAQGQNSTTTMTVNPSASNAAPNDLAQQAQAPSAVDRSPLNQTLPNQVTGQVADQVRIMIRADQREAQLQLHPRELGAVNIRIALHADQADVSIEASNPDLYRELSTTLPRLRQLFVDEGMGLSQLALDMGQFQQGQQSQGEHQSRPSTPLASSHQTVTDTIHDVLTRPGSKALSEGRSLDLYA